jgi:deoxyribose-phosphate aldolase
MIDLTSLNGDDTEGRVKRLCAKARNPLRQDLLEAIGMADYPLTTGAVCVYHALVETAVASLKGSGVPVAAVSTGFPAGLAPMHTKIAEIEASVAAGAGEIDIVITRALVLNQKWKELYDEVKAYKAACGRARLKTIIATGELATPDNVAKASLVCMMAGADFIKTSTGTETVNATLPVSLVMIRQIREFYELTGQAVSFKPAGGIRTAKEAVNFLILMKEELGDRWLNSDMFRFGASGLLNDLERQIEFHVTGRYSAAYRHAMA